MYREVFKRIIIEGQEFINEVEVYPRDVDIDYNFNYVFTGSRRAGKTYVMYQIAKEFVREVGIEQIIFVNFEDERLIGLEAKDLGQVLEAYYNLFDTKTKPIIFLDEIHIVEGWEKFVRRLADQKYRVFVTGSNARMLSHDIATTLGGRFIIREIFPLSFKEFLRFNNIEFHPRLFFGKQVYEIKSLFEQYFYYGGFPEVMNLGNKKQYLSNLFQKLFYGDLIARNNIKNVQALRLLLKKLAESTCDEISFTRLANIIKSAGIKVGTATLIEYARFLQQSYLVFSLSNVRSKFTDRESIKKFYFIDTGILNLFLINPEAKLLETLVFNHLYRTVDRGSLFYYRDNYEVDFYVQPRSLIQVSYDLANSVTLDREVKSLVKAAERLGTEDMKIITFDQEDTINYRGKEIAVLPVWKWLLTSGKKNAAL